MIAELEQARRLALDERRLAIRHCFSALVTSALHTMICVFFFQGGYFVGETKTLVAILVTIWLGNLLLAGLVFSRVTLQRNDPSMSLIWNIWLTAGFLVSAYFVDDFRISLVLFYFASMLLASFRQRLGVLISLAVAASLGYLVVIYLAWDARSIYLNLFTEMLQWTIFTLTAIGFSITGAGINALRKKLTAKNDELGEALSKVREMAIRDELTGLFNRRHIMDALSQQKALADSGDYCFTLCYLDLDHFKQINDTWGHGTGDEVLKRFARVVESVLRDADYTGRLGGEEFVLVLTQTEPAGACVVAERLRETLEAQDFSDIQPGMAVTVSIGVAAYRPGEALDTTLSRADACLYLAKSNGRNRIVSELDKEALESGNRKAQGKATSCA